MRKHFDYETRLIDPPLTRSGVRFTTEIVRVQATELEGPGARVFLFMSEEEANECLEVLKF